MGTTTIDFLWYGHEERLPPQIFKGILQFLFLTIDPQIFFYNPTILPLHFLQVYRQAHMITTLLKRYKCNTISLTYLLRQVTFIEIVCGIK